MTTQTSKLLSGKPAAQYWDEMLRKKISERVSKAPLCLATVQIGAAPDVELYSQALTKILDRYGIKHIHKVWKSEKDISSEAKRLYDDDAVTGVLVFSPIAPTVDAQQLFLNLPIKKDVEGRTFIKRNFFGVFSPTGKAVMALLIHLRDRVDPSFTIKGKHAVMVGHSDLVGKPTAMLLSDEGATVTVCHKDTQNIQKHISEADILVVAIGKPGVIRSEWIKKGAVVIDVGENFVDGKLVGDVDLASALNTVSYISPVPGGVGPLTNLMVIDNLITLDKYKDLLNGNH